jgi:hypothetical protein
METIILVMLMGGMNLLAFLIGARVGQKVVNNAPVELPTINPITLYKEHKDKEEMSKEQEKLNTMLDNINNYDGSSANQKEI